MSGLEIFLLVGVLLVILLLLLLLVRKGKGAGIGEVGIAPFLDKLEELVRKQRGDEEFQRQMQEEVRHLSDSLKSLAEAEQHRREREQELGRTIEHIESVLRGTKSAGMAGENIVREVLEQLPPDYLVHNYRTQGGLEVEFGLRLFDGRVLPIDSKLVAMEQVAKLAEAQGAERALLIKEIQNEALKQAKKIAVYLGTPDTHEMAIMAVPDAVFSAAREVVARIYDRFSVLVVPYSMAVQYLLTFLRMDAQRSASLDESRVRIFLEEVSRVISEMDETLENKVARASTMLSNTYDEYKQALSKLRASLLALRQDNKKGDSN